MARGEKMKGIYERVDGKVIITFEDDEKGLNEFIEMIEFAIEVKERMVQLYGEAGHAF